MSKFKLLEVTYEINRYMPSFKIIDNEIAIEDIEKEDGSIAYLHDIDEETAKSIVQALEKQMAKYVNYHASNFSYWSCPECGRIYWERDFIGVYCSSCGQKLMIR